MKPFGLFLLLTIALLFEASLIQLPLILLILLMIAVTYQEVWIFPLGLVCGLLLDGLTFHPLGESSLFYMLFLLLVFLYERKFELRSIWFAIFMTFISSLIFMYFYGYVFLFPQVIISVMIGIFLFYMFTSIHKPPQKDTIRSWKI